MDNPNPVQIVCNERAVLAMLWSGAVGGEIVECIASNPLWDQVKRENFYFVFHFPFPSVVEVLETDIWHYSASKNFSRALSRQYQPAAE